MRILAHGGVKSELLCNRGEGVDSRKWATARAQGRSERNCSSRAGTRRPPPRWRAGLAGRSRTGDSGEGHWRDGVK